MLPKEDYYEEKACKERVRAVLGRWNVSIATLETTETRRVRMRNQINGDSFLTFDVLRKVAYALPKVSCDWLLLGEGSMLKAEHVAPHIHHNSYNNQLAPGSTQTGPVVIGHDTISVIREREIEERDAIIQQQAERIAELEKDKEILSGLLSALTKNNNNTK